jgi:hypothetical protein
MRAWFAPAKASAWLHLIVPTPAQRFIDTGPALPPVYFASINLALTGQPAKPATPFADAPVFGQEAREGRAARQSVVAAPERPVEIGPAHALPAPLAQLAEQLTLKQNQPRKPRKTRVFFVGGWSG